MGDRTSVTLTIPAQYREAASVIFKDHDDTPGDSFDAGNPEGWPFPLFCYCFYEVNYGTLDFLDDLMNAGIPFDSNWDSGSEYGPGIETCRFTADGEAIRKEVADEYRNPNVNVLMTMIDNYELLKKTITERYAEVTSLPWENQIEYSKVYRLKKLITPKDE